MVIRIAAGDKAAGTATPGGPRHDDPRHGDARPGDGKLIGSVRALLRGLPVTLLMAALPFLAAAAYLKLHPPMFTAASGVFADPAAGRVGGATLAQAEGYIPLATSRPVFDRAVEASNLMQDASIIVGPAPFAQRIPDFFDRLRGQLPEQANRRAALLQHLSLYAHATPSRDANVIDIAVSATDAPSALRLANAVAEAFVEEATAALDRRAPAGAARKIGRGDDLRRRLRDAEGALQRFRADAGLDAAGDPALELQRLRTKAADAKARHERIQQALAGGGDGQALGALIRSPAIDRLRAEANEAASQEASMRATLGPRHPSYLEAASNAAEKKKLLSEAVRLSASAVRAEWRAAETQAKALETGAAVPRTAPVLAAGSPDAQRLAELEKAVQAARAALDAHLRSPDAGGEAAIARIVRPAAVSESDPKPRAGMIWTLAALAAMVIALLKMGSILVGAARAGHARLATAPAGGGTPNPVRAPHQGHGAPLAERQPEMATDLAGHAAGEPFVERRRASAGRGDPGSPEVAALVRELSDRAWSAALQTTLVVGADGADVATTAMEISIGAAAENLRVLLLDADEHTAALSRVLADVPLSAYVAIQGRKRAMGTFESKPGHPIWFAPAEALAYARGRIEAPLILSSLAGNFDILLITGPELGRKAGEDLLAAAAELVAVVTTGTERDPSKFATRLRAPANRLRIIPGAVPMVERRREPQDVDQPRSASLFRFQEG